MKRIVAAVVLVAGLTAGCGLCMHDPGSSTTTTAPSPTTTTDGGPVIQICPPLC